jgi:hypothetical protein
MKPFQLNRIAYIEDLQENLDKSNVWMLAKPFDASEWTKDFCDIKNCQPDGSIMSNLAMAYTQGAMINLGVPEVKKLVVEPASNSSWPNPEFEHWYLARTDVIFKYDKTTKDIIDPNIKTILSFIEKECPGYHRDGFRLKDVAEGKYAG